jgi:hypothetical protein
LLYSRDESFKASKELAMKITTKSIAVAALATIAAAGAAVATQGTASAKDTTYFCDMKGTWANSAGAKDDFVFLAEYLAKDGPDYFAGKYENPGQATADIVGRSTNNVWEILFTYTDAGHKGMLKKATGQGFRDGGRNEVTVEGTYKTFLGTNDIKADGIFKLQGKCRKTR